MNCISARTSGAIRITAIESCQLTTNIRIVVITSVNAELIAG